MLNSMELLGKVVQKPRLIQYRPGKFMCKLRVGCRSWFQRADGRWTGKDLYIDLQIWGGTAQEAVEKYPMGSWVFARGPLAIEDYQSKKDGSPRRGVFVNIGGHDSRLLGLHMQSEGHEDHQLFDRPAPSPSELFDEKPEDDGEAEGFV